MNNKNNKKGKLLEQVAAELHHKPNIKLETNVMIPPIGRSGKPREIDILITASVAGYPVKIPIECKNNNKKVGAPEIDTYIGKLEDINLSIQNSIYISSKGYTKGALERAKKAGIRTLIFHGLTESGESLELFNAIQSVVYVMPMLHKLIIINKKEKSLDFDPLYFFNSKLSMLDVYKI